MKSKGLLAPEVRTTYPQYSGVKDGWDSASLRSLPTGLEACLVHVRSTLGGTQIRSDGAKVLIAGIWPELGKILGQHRLVGSAMSSDSNGIAERRIRSIRALFGPVIERDGAHNWKFSTPTVMACLNSAPNFDATGHTSELSPEQRLMCYHPRRIHELLHDVSNLPDTDIKRMIEDRQDMVGDIRLSSYDAMLSESQRIIIRQSSRYRDMPPTWSDGSTTDHWVYL